MNRRTATIDSLAMCVITLIAVLSAPDLSAQASRKAISYYTFGETMTDLILKQRAEQGASPALIEGLRQGLERELATSPIEVTLFDDGTLDMKSGSSGFSTKYQIRGEVLFVQRTQTKEFVEFGYFTKKRSILTINNSILLDRSRIPE